MRRRPTIIGAVAVAAAAVVPFLGVTDTWVSLLVFTMANVLLAQSVNFLGGFAGQLSLGQGGFYAVGAYASALLMLRLDLPFWASLPSAVVIAAAVGYVVSIPAERVHHFYLAMLTLAFASVTFVVIKQWRPVTGGFSGISSIPSPTLGNLELFGFGVNLATYYLIVLAALTAVSTAQWLIVRSYYGRAMVMVSEHEIVASTLGINAGRVKHTAYTLAAALAGLGGALYAHAITFLGPESFTPVLSIDALVYAILGGVGSLIGPFLGAAFFTILPHQLQAFRENQLLIYGLILFFSYIVLPRGLAGLLPLRTRQAERPPVARLRRNTDDVMADGLPRRARLPDGADGPDGNGQPATHDAPGGQSVLEVCEASKEFVGVRALQGVSMTVRAGEIHGLIGPNGSGKTTLVNVISGIYRPDGGRVLYRGRDITALPAARRPALGVLRTFQNPQLPRRMTVLEAVLVGAHRHFAAGLVGVVATAPRARREEVAYTDRAMAVIADLGLEPVCDEVTASLPYGKQRMVELARAIVARPEVLILDEPAAGLSGGEIAELGRVLRRLREGGLTMLVIEHHMDFLLDLVQAVTVLDFGKVIFDGDPLSLQKNKAVEEAYLGVAADA